MTNSYRNAIAAATLIAMLTGGCASAPDINYYTLDMSPSGSKPPSVNIAISRMQVAESLSRTDILIQTSATEVEYYASDRWVSNISALVREKLQAEFGPSRPDQDTVSLSGEIYSFGQVDTAEGAESRIKISIIVTGSAPGGEQTRPVDKVYDVTTSAASANPGAVVAALSKGLESIAASIASDIAAAH